MKQSIVLITLFSMALFGCKSSQHPELGDGIFADIQTNKGDIIVKLEHEKTPVTVASFVSLAEGNSPFVTDSLKGKKYYDGIIFHRVIKDFMIQTGDPLGTGTGNPGYKFRDEFHDSLTHSKKGILSMANSGPKTNGSQFFITHTATPWLDGLDENGNSKPCGNPGVSCHTVFGEVVEGIGVVDTIAHVMTLARDKPQIDVVMNKVEIIRNGKEARKFDAVKIMTDYFEEEKAAEAAAKKLLENTVAEFEKQKEEAEETASGLRILFLKKGDGEQPKVGQKVLVHYAGWLSDGSLFDSSIEEIATKFGKFNPARKAQGGYAPFPMAYGPEAQLIPGFKEGLQAMKVGDKIRVFIPPHLGYGAQGAGPIPPNSDLVFDLEIVGIQE